MAEIMDAKLADARGFAGRSPCRFDLDAVSP